MMPTTEPAWDIAKLFPDQGYWSEDDYLHLPGRRLIEFVDGKIEVLEMPSERHQRIIIFLLGLLTGFVNPRGLGFVIVSPFKVKLRSGKFREPDLMFLFAENYHKRHEQFWDGADLVVEVVSPDDPERDIIQKRIEYAQAGIGEYWLVNPLNESITVFTLPEGMTTYREHGVFSKEQQATSLLLENFSVDVASTFSA
jgi:Uma2 family endonuclease